MPYFETFGQADLINYFAALADRSTKPLYLRFAGITRTTLELETVLQLSKHPNIRGIKCSGNWMAVWRLINSVDDGFRVIPAQPLMIDLLVRGGVPDNLDGIYAVVPNLAASIAAAAEQGDYAEATKRQQQLASVLDLICHKYPLFPACSAILQARDVPVRVYPIPDAAAFGGTEGTVVGRTGIARVVFENVGSRIADRCFRDQWRRLISDCIAQRIVR